MKNVKVLMYKDPFKGTLKHANREITPLVGDSIYYIPSEKEWDTELVFHIDGLYFSMGHFSLTNFQNNPSHSEKAVAVHQSFEQYIEELARPTLLHIEVFKLLGRAYDHLVQRREAYDKAKAEEREQKAAAEKAAKCQEAAERRARVLTNVDALKNDGSITYQELEEIIKEMGVKIHPRTRGTIRKIANQTLGSTIGKSRGNFMKGITNTTAQNIFNVVAKIVEL